MRKTLVLLLITLFTNQAFSQDIPQHISYVRIYEFMDELATDGLIDLNTAIKPYSRKMITQKLLETQEKNEQLNERQRTEIKFFLNEYALENNQLPFSFVNLWNKDTSKAALFQPAIHYKDSLFKARITPLIGLNVMNNANGNIIKRWIGAEFQASIGKYISIFASVRDISIDGDTLSSYNYLNNYPGYEYKESTKGGDYSDSRGGIKFSTDWLSIGLVKDNVVWGDNYNGSNILSGRTPSFPMITLQLKPAKWFELNYFHAWLTSNVIDSSYYYLENQSKIWYRPANKFMAANMLTFTPFRKFKISVGNSIIYAEKTIQGAYFIPIAFYKSIDHTLTKGLGTENQNSQMFMNISSRNLKHTHLYGSVFTDEINFDRFKSGNAEANPISVKLGASIANFPVENLSAVVEFTRSNILNYKHFIPVLSYKSNTYNLGHYLGDNAQEMYVALQYKPLRGLDLKLTYTNAKHGNEYEYVKRGVYNGISGNVSEIISQPSLGEVIWHNKTIGFNGMYEIFNNAYIVVKAEMSDIQAFEPLKEATFGERRMTAQQTLDYFTPKYLQGKQTTFSGGISFGF